MLLAQIAAAVHLAIELVDLVAAECDQRQHKQNDQTAEGKAAAGAFVLLVLFLIRVGVVVGFLPGGGSLGCAAHRRGLLGQRVGLLGTGISIDLHKQLLLYFSTIGGDAYSSTRKYISVTGKGLAQKAIIP